MSSNMVRLYRFNLNKINAALLQRSVILKNILNIEDGIVINDKSYQFGDDAKIIHKIIQKHKILKLIQKNELVIKYKNGMSMSAIAKLYGCHYTTVGRILRKKGVFIRKS